MFWKAVNVMRKISNPWCEGEDTDIESLLLLYEWCISESEYTIFR